MSGGALTHFILEPVEMRMGGNPETLSFTVAPGMERPLLLALAWLQKCNPYVNWQKNLKSWRRG